MKKNPIFLLITCLLILLTGCGKKSPNTESAVYNIYEVNKAETKVTSRQVYFKEADSNQTLDFLINELTCTPDNTDSRAAIPDSVKLMSFTFDDETATLNFSTEYSQLSLTGEVLSRAAIVRTLTQIPDIKYVTFLVNNSPLMNRSGVPVGVMKADQFIDNSGKEINAEEKVDLCLYFSNEKGDKLVKVNREVQYSSNISLEKLVMEQLIKGVNNEEDAYPTINPDTSIVSVTVSDGTCYVNLDDAFLTQIYNINAEITIFSIVNSLIELSDVNRVQISVNGETSISYKEAIKLDDIFERNLELVESE